MKNIIYKIGFLLLSFTLVISCESPEAETNYKPANYEFPVEISLASSNITNSSFDFSYTNAGMGEGRYVVLTSGSPAPSSNDVFSGDAAGTVQAGGFNLDGQSIAVTSVTDLCDNEAYDVYAVQMSSDNFLSETPTMISVTTVENPDIVGVYSTVTNGYNGWFGEDAVDFTGTVNIINNGDGTFTIDDVSAGWYAYYYGHYGASIQTGTMDVPCKWIDGEIATQFIGCCGDVITFEGVINLDGTITVSWSNSFFGDSATAVYTKL